MKERIVFDPAFAADSDKIGAFLQDAAGNLLTSTLVSGKQSLDVNVSQSALPAGAATEATLATRASETTLATRASESTLAAILLDTTDIEIATEAAAADIASLKKLEDAVHASGDAGIQILAVRKDSVGSLVSADGDYSSLQVDSSGALRVAGSFAQSVPNTAIQASSITATTTPQVLVSALANRQVVKVQNIGSKTLFVGHSSVTASNGWRISAGAYMDIELGPSVAIYGLTDSSTTDVRILQIA